MVNVSRKKRYIDPYRMDVLNDLTEREKMIASANPTSSTSINHENLRDLAKQLLAKRIEFIANSEFERMDSDRAWMEEDPEGKALEFLSRTQKTEMPIYLEAICSSPLLTAEEERQLFRRMNYLKYRADAIRSTLDRTRPSLRKIRNIQDLLDRAEKIRNRIVNANTRLVVSIVKKFADEKNRFDELLSDGIGCLIRAVDKFDFDRGFRFSTYATMAVQRDILRAVKRNHRDRTRFATGAFELLDEQYGEQSKSDQTQLALLNLQKKVGHLIRELDEREQFIVEARCGLLELGSKPTFSKLGEILGVSKERVRQLDLRAMTKLRALVAKHKLALPEH